MIDKKNHLGTTSVCVLQLYSMAYPLLASNRKMRTHDYEPYLTREKERF